MNMLLFTMKFLEYVILCSVHDKQLALIELKLDMLAHHAV